MGRCAGVLSLRGRCSGGPGDSRWRHRLWLLRSLIIVAVALAAYGAFYLVLPLVLDR